MAVLFSANEIERRSLAQDLVDLVLRYRGQINFVTVDAGKLPFLLEPFGLSADRLPAFVLQTTDIHQLKYDSRITADAVDKFIKRILRIVEITAVPVPEREL